MTQNAQTTIPPNRTKTMALSFGKIKWLTIYIQLCQEMSHSDYPIPGAEIARARKRAEHPLITSKPTAMMQNSQTTIPSNCHKAVGLGHSKKK